MFLAILLQMVKKLYFFIDVQFVGRQSQFQITDLSRATYQGIPYDIGSVMHYSARAFSRNGQPTILPVDTSFPLNRIGQRNGLSASDIQHVRTLYCSGKLSLYCLILSYFHLPIIILIIS